MLCTYLPTTVVVYIIAQYCDHNFVVHDGDICPVQALPRPYRIVHEDYDSKLMYGSNSKLIYGSRLYRSYYRGRGGFLVCNYNSRGQICAESRYKESDSNVLRTHTTYTHRNKISEHIDLCNHDKCPLNIMDVPADITICPEYTRISTQYSRYVYNHNEIVEYYYYTSASLAQLQYHIHHPYKSGILSITYYKGAIISCVAGYKNFDDNWHLHGTTQIYDHTGAHMSTLQYDHGKLTHRITHYTVHTQNLQGSTVHTQNLHK